VVNLAAFAAAHPQSAFSPGDVPGETAHDSGPYDVIAYRGGRVVADARADDLLHVSAAGSRLNHWNQATAAHLGRR
jgi:hypothetical protein